MIKIENLTKTYNYKKSNAFTALTDVSLTVEDGEMLAIIGKSGAGKSTLLHIIGCIDTFEKGTYTLDDISVLRWMISAYINYPTRNWHRYAIKRSVSLCRILPLWKNIPFWKM